MKLEAEVEVFSKLGGTFVISGAFGLYRRATVVQIGGYDAGTVGEDMELIVHLHRHCREQKIPYQIAYIPDPVAWTQCPEDLRTLGNQRDRWQRGRRVVARASHTFSPDVGDLRTSSADFPEAYAGAARAGGPGGRFRAAVPLPCVQITAPSGSLR